MAAPPHYQFELHAALAPDGVWEVALYYFKPGESDFAIAVYSEHVTFTEASRAAFRAMGDAQKELSENQILLPDLGDGVKVRYGPNIQKG
jgi:hypothetical protein